MFPSYMLTSWISWCKFNLVLVLMLGISRFILNESLLVISKVKVIIYIEILMVIFFNFLKCFLHESLLLIPMMIQIILFCNLKMVLL